MRLHGRGVDQHLRSRAACGDKGSKYLGPDTFCCPTLEPVVEGFTGTIGRRGVLPAAPRKQHLDNPADDASVVDTGLAACVGRQMRFNPSKLRVRQPIQSLIQGSPPAGNLESHPVLGWNHFYGSWP